MRVIGRGDDLNVVVVRKNVVKIHIYERVHDKGFAIAPSRAPERTANHSA